MTAPYDPTTHDHLSSDPRLARRLWAKVDASGDCWQWTASVNPKGYGRFNVSGRSQLAHRVVWAVLVGPIPTDTETDHLCRNRGCVNPDHLEMVSSRTNALRGYGPAGLYARRDTCVAGHDLTDPANVYTAPGVRTRNTRYCRQCTIERNAAGAAAANERHRNRYATDPEYRERRRAAGRARAADPEHRELLRERYATDPDYRTARIAARRDYVARNRDVVNARSLARYAANRDEINARQRERRAANRGESNARQREWYAANRDELNARQRDRRAANRDELNARRRAAYAVRRDQANNGG